MRRLTLLLILSLTVLAISAPLSTADDTEPTFVFVTPGPDTVIANYTPEISIRFNDPDGIDTSSVILIIDGIDVSDWEETIINETGVIYRTPSILAMTRGPHNVSIEATDGFGNLVGQSWSFTIDPSAKGGGGFSDEQMAQIEIVLLIGGVLSGLIIVIYLAFIIKFKRFTFRKFYIRRPKIKRKFLIIYIPIFLAFISYFASMIILRALNFEDPFVNNYIILAIIVAGLMPFAISARMDLKRISNYERAFAQFLFELADAIRGGVDPAKALLELSNNNRTILKQHLKTASDGIRIGKPFDEVFDHMVQPIDSDLIKRYASLVGESSRMGGDISIVIHRAAQDMDELIKIEEDRRRQLMMQATTIYIGFGVMLIIIYQLVGLYPSIGSISIGDISTGVDSSGGVEGASGGSMGFDTLKNRFYQVALSVGLCCGCLIGAFTEGKVRYGLIHALVLAIVATVFFAFLVFPI